MVKLLLTTTDNMTTTTTMIMTLTMITMTMIMTLKMITMTTVMQTTAMLIITLMVITTMIRHDDGDDANELLFVKHGYHTGQYNLSVCSFSSYLQWHGMFCRQQAAVHCSSAVRVRDTQRQNRTGQALLEAVGGKWVAKHFWRRPVVSGWPSTSGGGRW